MQTPNVLVRLTRGVCVCIQSIVENSTDGLKHLTPRSASDFVLADRANERQ